MSDPIPIQTVESPVICKPYYEPTHYGEYERATGRAHKREGRRPSAYWYKDLLRHWWRKDRARRLFFCQVEAAETDDAFARNRLGELLERRPLMVLNDEGHHAYRPRPMNRPTRLLQTGTPKLSCVRSDAVRRFFAKIRIAELIVGCAERYSLRADQQRRQRIRSEGGAEALAGDEVCQGFFRDARQRHRARLPQVIAD